MKKERVTWLYAESCFTPWREAISGTIVAALLLESPATYEHSIVHYLDGSKQLETMLLDADVVMNLCYGYGRKTQPEIAAWLDGLGVCHTSPPSAVQQLAQDKASYQDVCAKLGISTPPNIDPSEVAHIDDVLVVKPRQGGCHIDIEAAPGAELAQRGRVRDGYLYQPYIYGRELSVSVIPTKDCRTLTILPPIEVVPRDLRRVFIAGQRTRLDFEPDLAQTTLVAIRDVARQLYESMPLGPYARIDLRLSDEGELLVLDINAMPNLAPGRSYIPRCCEHHGYGLRELMRRIIEYSLNRYHRPASGIARGALFESSIESDLVNE